nr:serine hydrolase [uncultured Blautia sp.]
MKKNTFLYIVIAVLVIALAGLGALNVRTLDKLASLQSKVNELQKNVQEVSDSAAELSSKADQLDALYPDDPTVASAAANAQTDSQASSDASDSDTQNSTDSASQDSTDSVSQDSASADSKDSSSATQEEGTLSPSSGSSTFTDNSDSSMDNVLNQVQALLPTDNGTWSVYVCNLAKNTEGAINDQQMQAASLIKLYIMGAVYEDYDKLSASYGKDSLDNNLNSMITVSDNAAANTLVNYLGSGDDAAGMARVNKFCQDHGYTSTSMGRLLLADNSNGDNYTSVKDCGKFLKTIYQQDKGTSTEDTLAGAEYMYHLLKMQTRQNKIPAQMPDGVKVANKTGELDTVENDAGIIYDTAKGIDLVICFMSQDVKDTSAAQSTIAEDSRAIYGYYNE